ncbi:MAG: hypothetical protein HXY37_11045 [Chloroflexi bacterium]|nr:hypothetical protein [Chloroflexota bacterium]
MSYRYQSSYQPARRAPGAIQIMSGLLVTFVVVSLLVMLAGRVPFVPSVTPIAGPTYKDYVLPARELLTSYGYTLEGNVHIPIDRAMDLIAERGLPTRSNPSPTP